MPASLNSPAVPLTVIGGYLGAGKSTLLNHILRCNQGRRLAVIVNDFGKINIDAQLIESRDGDAINLSNGCVCCTLSGGLGVTLNTLTHREPPPEHIIIEVSGVADPAKVAQFGHVPGLRLDGVIVLADAETIRHKTRDKYVGETVLQQLQGADVLVLNKVDLVSEETRQAVRDWLAGQVPGARVIETVEGNVPLALLLGNAIERPDMFLKSVRSDDHHHPDYDTWSYTANTPSTATPSAP